MPARSRQAIVGTVRHISHDAHMSASIAPAYNVSLPAASPARQVDACFRVRSVDLSLPASSNRIPMITLRVLSAPSSRRRKTRAIGISPRPSADWLMRLAAG
jgi:hypothetical protein